MTAMSTTVRRRRRYQGPVPPSTRAEETAQPAPAAESQALPDIRASGVLELHPKGYGFLRDAEKDYHQSPVDVFVPAPLVEQFHLRPGNRIEGVARERRKQEGARLEEVHNVEGLAPEEFGGLKTFDQLTPITPETWLRLEMGPQPLTTRVMDLLTPLGKGQRALIVAPPRTGKTILLHHVGHAISTNWPGVHLIALLVDERPEEVTEFRRNLTGEVLASSLDREIESHVRLARLVIERCKRLAEMGRDVVLLVDSITRIARAFNKWVGNTGRTMTGGLDIRALDVPKQLFASARAFEEGGSLTILATALVETGSRMDDLIFEEFKGTGNMELSLDRRLADRRIWPALDPTRSGTRREEKLLDPETLQAVTSLRRVMSTMDPADAMQHLTSMLAKFPTNPKFLQWLRDSRRLD